MAPSWAAVLFAPHQIVAVYVTNFDVMPELHWAFGCLLAVALVSFAVLVRVIFRRSTRMWAGDTLSPSKPLGYRVHPC